MRKPNPKNIEYKNDYNSRKYDRMTLMVPKGRKQDIDAWAEGKGCKSTNLYISGLIRTDMQLTEEDWKKPPENCE